MKYQYDNKVKRSKYFFIIFFFTIGLIILFSFLFSKKPLDTIYYFLFGAFQNIFVFGNMLNNATLFLIASLGISIVFHIGFFNLGGEGQIYAGAFTSTIFLLSFPQLQRFHAILIAFFIAILTGGVLCLIPAILKVKLKVNELISTYLLSRITILVVNFFLTGVFLDRTSNLITTKKIADTYRLETILKPSYLDTSIFLAIFFAIIIYIYLHKTRFGYNTIISGKNKEFAKYGAVNVNKYILISAFISGALGGIGGFTSVIGTHYAVIKEFSSGVGFSAMAVSLIARNNPLVIILSALFFAYIEAGANVATLNSGTSIEMSIVIESIIFIIITTNILSGLKEK